MKIVIDYGAFVPEEALAKVRQLGEVVQLKDGRDETVLRELRDAAAFSYLGPTKSVVTREIMASSPKLRIVARMGVGTDSIDKVAATELGVVVTNVPDISANAVAEHTVGLVFALARKIALGDRMMREGKGWQIRNRTIQANMHTELEGKTWGVIGLGKIGGRVASKANALGMNVVYNKRNRLQPEAEKKQNIKYLPLEELLRVSDVVSMHLPLNSETESLINKKTLKLMKSTAFLINHSRGKVADDDAVVEALRTNKLGGYGTDVWVEEPPPTSHPLYKLDNAVCTPHWGGSTRDCMGKAAILVYENVAKVLKGEDPISAVNVEVLSNPKARYKTQAPKR
jgi:D-3-phosphoglycerate dehydrogenase